MKYLLLVLSFVAQSVLAQSYFKDGTKWKTSYYGYAQESSVPTYMFEIDELDGYEIVDGYEALKMYHTHSDKPSERNLNLYIRTEGDKVYFKYASGENSDWYLMYDFGLKEGEGCYVYSPFYSDDKVPYKSYIKVTGFDTDEQTKMTLIRLNEYKDETCSTEYSEEGAWIKGLSSLLGVDSPGGFGLGGTPLLQLEEVSYEDNVVYKASTTGIQNTQDHTFKVAIEGNKLHITNIDVPSKVTLYTVDGAICKQIMSNSNCADIVVPSNGTYILKVGDKSKKVVM